MYNGGECERGCLYLGNRGKVQSLEGGSLG